MNDILFVAKDRNISMGSYRIWINDLNYYFNNMSKLNCNSKIYDYKNPQDIKDAKVIICGKNDASLAAALKKQFPEKKIGVINLAADKKINIDFIIVGSLEEKDSLSEYDNVFLYPLIEKMYEDENIKQHKEKNIIRIGFHGHYPHLSKFEPHLKNALENIDKNYDIELLVISSNPPFEWSYGRPNIENIIMKDWDIKTIKEDILSCDIGIVPNVTHISYSKETHPTSNFLGLYSTDHIFRLKNKSNAGRAFVFHQLGIPVVADFTPSNFHVMGDPKCGYLAHSRAGWEKSLEELMDHKKRNSIAHEARKQFNKLYNPTTWASRLYESIRSIEQ